MLCVAFASGKPSNAGTILAITLFCITDAELYSELNAQHGGFFLTGNRHWIKWISFNTKTAEALFCKIGNGF